MQTPIYFDYNATTPVDEIVLEEMLPYFKEQFGNASSKGHAFGWVAEEAVKIAREHLADLLGATPDEIIFTSGATESISFAIKGVAKIYAPQRNHIITVGTEHKAVLQSCEAVSQTEGINVTYLPVDEGGRINLQDLEQALTDKTALVSVMWANNETGVIQDIPAIADLVRKRKILLMTDATQAIGKVPVSVSEIDILVGSGHKFYAPKGVGFLFMRRRNPRVRLFPLLHGSQEKGLRGGTLNVPGIVGIGTAAQVVKQRLQQDALHYTHLRDMFEQKLIASLTNVKINGNPATRLPQTSSLCFEGVKSADMIKVLRDIAVSAGSACASGSAKPSHVLKAMGLSDEDALSSLRFSFGRYTTEAEIMFAVQKIIEVVPQLSLNPVP